jgi:hypothetical protein
VEAIDTARKRDAELTVLHVDLYQNNGNVTRSELERAVEADSDRSTGRGTSFAGGSSSRRRSWRRSPRRAPTWS